MTSLDVGPDMADFRIQIAAEEQERGNSENRDQRKNECVLRETLPFLAVKEQEQERPPFTRTACRVPALAGWGPDRSGDLRVVGGMDAHPKAYLGMPAVGRVTIVYPIGGESMGSLAASRSASP